MLWHRSTKFHKLKILKYSTSTSSCQVQNEINIKAQWYDDRHSVSYKLGHFEFQLEMSCVMSDNIPLFMRLCNPPLTHTSHLM